LKKLFALFLVLAFVAACAGMVSAQYDSRTPGEKLEAGRAYLKLLDKKIIKHRKLGNTGVVRKLKVEKTQTITRMKKWKAQAEAEEMAPPPPPVAPAPPPPPPPPVVRRAPKPAASGLFGMGLKTSADIGYLTGAGSTASILGGGSIILDDPMAIGSMIGLADDAVNYKLGLGLTYGKDQGDSTFNAVLITFDTVLNLPEDMMGGVASYAGVQVNYPVYKSDVSGVIGGLVYGGLKGDVGLGGDSYVEVGYGAVRRTGQSSKGIDIKFGQEILL